MWADTHGGRRAAENQALFRQVNERIESVNETFDVVAPFGSWACECAETTCVERIEMTRSEYEAVRAMPSWFAVAPSDEHVWPDVEEVFGRSDRYWIVAKVGVAGERG